MTRGAPDALSPHLPDTPAAGSAQAPNLLARAQSPYTTREKVLRVLWGVLGQPAMRLTFHNWYGVRRMILRCFGASIARNVRVRRTVLIEQPWNLSIGENSSIGDRAVLYCLGRVTIGANASLSQFAHICAGTHDYRRPNLPLLRPPVVIGDHAWIAADAFVGPDVTVGEGAILGARGCAMKNLDAWSIYAGNPAARVKDRPRTLLGDAAPEG